MFARFGARRHGHRGGATAWSRPRSPSRASCSRGVRAARASTCDRCTPRSRRSATTAGGFTVARRGAASRCRCERLLVAAGRRSRPGRARGRQRSAWTRTARALPVDDHMRGRGAPRTWAVGDVTGKGAFTHVSMYQADIVVGDILGQPGWPGRYRAVPRVTFTDPEIGSVGPQRGAGPRGGADRAHRACRRSPSRPAAGSTRRATTGSSSSWRTPAAASWSARRRPARGRRGARHAHPRRARRGAGPAAQPHDLRVPDVPPGYPVSGSVTGLLLCRGH